MKKYLVTFAQSHSEFRLPELQSIAELYNFPYELADGSDVSRPFMIISLASEEDARLLARRCILIKSVHEFYASGSTYEELHTETRNNRDLWASLIPDTSFKFVIAAFNHRVSQSRQRATVESFSYMDLKGRIDLKTPQVVFTCFEEYPDRSRNGKVRERHEDDGAFLKVYFGRLLEEGSARSLISTFDVKKRSYFGNTSMEAEVSLLMANQALASPSKLLYDPFMGTGSMAYPAAYFGAMVFGSDIDGRQMRGKDSSTPGIFRAAEQYGVTDRILDICTFDITSNPWRCGGLFDAIITDPPYGVRAGAKRLGRKKEMTAERLAVHLQFRATSGDEEAPYIPPTKPYELSNLVVDLVLFSRYMLKVNGRLVFFLPTVTDEYEEVDIHTMLCPGMEVISNSLQDFGSWGRRLVTIRKMDDVHYPPPTFLPPEKEEEHIPAHRDFREKYFQGFKKDDSYSTTITPDLHSTIHQ